MMKTRSTKKKNNNNNTLRDSDSNTNIVSMEIDEKHNQKNNNSKQQTQSCKYLNACLPCILPYLGRYIPIQNGQVKGAVMKLLAGNSDAINNNNYNHNNNSNINDHSYYYPHKHWSNGITAKFNKMSGILEWHNCICLFVNIFSQNYLNLWREEDEKQGKMLQFTWFAQPTHNQHSPIIQRLIKHANNNNIQSLTHPTNNHTIQSNSNKKIKTNNNNDQSCKKVMKASEKLKIEAAEPIINSRNNKRKLKSEPSSTVISDTDNNTNNKKESNAKHGINLEIDSSTTFNYSNPSVLLFCRLLNEPYVYCGDLSAVNFDLQSTPISFRYRLNQSQHHHMKTSQAFQLLMNAAIDTQKIERNNGDCGSC